MAMFFILGFILDTFPISNTLLLSANNAYLIYIPSFFIFIILPISLSNSIVAITSRNAVDIATHYASIIEMGILVCIFDFHITGQL